MLIRILLISWTLCSFSTYVVAETLVWEFSIDEQSVKNGPEADGSTNSPGTGQGVVRLDTVTQMLSYDLTWSDLIGDLTKLHVHGPASANQSNPQHIVEIFGPPELPSDLVATSGSVSDSFQLQTLVQDGFAPIDADEIVDVLISGQAYLNVHTTVFGMGEIRGNLGIPVTVPEPASSHLLAIALLSLLGWRGRVPT